MKQLFCIGTIPATEDTAFMEETFKCSDDFKYVTLRCIGEG